MLRYKLLLKLRSRFIIKEDFEKGLICIKSWIVSRATRMAVSSLKHQKSSETAIETRENKYSLVISLINKLRLSNHVIYCQPLLSIENHRF